MSSRPVTTSRIVTWQAHTCGTFLGAASANCRLAQVAQPARRTADRHWPARHAIKESLAALNVTFNVAFLPFFWDQTSQQPYVRRVRCLSCKPFLLSAGFSRLGLSGQLNHQAARSKSILSNNSARLAAESPQKLSASQHSAGKPTSFAGQQVALR